MDFKKFTAELRGEILWYIQHKAIKQTAFASSCGKLRNNFNQWLNSKKGMNLESFCNIYVAMGGELQDIFDALHKRQLEKKKKEERKQFKLRGGYNYFLLYQK